MQKILLLFSGLLLNSVCLLAQAENKVAPMPAGAGMAAFSAGQKVEIEQIVRNYLIANPEILVEMANTLQQRQQAQALNKAQQAIMRNAARLFESPLSPIAGNPKGRVNVVEFFDYQCGYCKRTAPIIQAVLQADSNVRVIYKEFPIFGDDSKFAARAALAANKQGKYAAFHHALMQTEGKLTPDVVLQIAKQTGLNVPQLQTDMDAPAITAQLAENAQLASALGVAGTPSFVVAANPVVNPTAKNKAFFLPGAVPEQTLKDYIAKAK